MPRKSSSKRARRQSTRHVEAPIHYVEEAVVLLHALDHYHGEELTLAEAEFIGKTKRNLAVIAKRLRANSG